jgi:hypothetical protein
MCWVILVCFINGLFCISMRNFIYYFHSLLYSWRNYWSMLKRKFSIIKKRVGFRLHILNLNILNQFGMFLMYLSSSFHTFVLDLMFIVKLKSDKFLMNYYTMKMIGLLILNFLVIGKLNLITSSHSRFFLHGSR